MVWWVLWFGVLPLVWGSVFSSALLGRGISSDSLHFLGTQISPLWVPFPRLNCTCSASPHSGQGPWLLKQPQGPRVQDCSCAGYPTAAGPPIDTKVYQMQGVILMPLNPPENDYLFLSIISFFFFISLCNPAPLVSPSRWAPLNYHQILLPQICLLCPHPTLPAPP